MNKLVLALAGATCSTARQVLGALSASLILVLVALGLAGCVLPPRPPRPALRRRSIVPPAPASATGTHHRAKARHHPRKRTTVPVTVARRRRQRRGRVGEAAGQGPRAQDRHSRGAVWRRLGRTPAAVTPATGSSPGT